MQQEESEAPSVRNTYTMAITREKVKYPPCAHVKRKTDAVAIAIAGIVVIAASVQEK